MTVKMLLIGLLIFILFAGVMVYFLTKNVYISSPGHVSAEGYEKFKEESSTCHGKSILLNPEEAAVDAPSRSLCIGILVKNKK